MVIFNGAAFEPCEINAKCAVSLFQCIGSGISGVRLHLIILTFFFGRINKLTDG